MTRERLFESIGGSKPSETEQCVTRITPENPAQELHHQQNEEASLGKGCHVRADPDRRRCTEGERNPARNRFSDSDCI